MVRAANPFRPGFNQAPTVLAGRDDLLDSIRDGLATAAFDGRTPRPILLTGSRGVGKTVILREAANIAATEHSWLSVAVEVHPQRAFTHALLDPMRQARDRYRQSTTTNARWHVGKATLKASVAGVGGEAEFTRTTPAEPPPDLVAVINETMTAAAERQAGLLLTVDELHLADKADLATLAGALQDAVDHDWPLVTILAGLPTIQSPRRMVTYLERGEWHTLGLLDASDTTIALVGPARGAGRPMDADAAALLTTASGGYPYAIQVVGHHTWRASHGHDTITLRHAEEGLRASHRDLADGLFASRWQDTSSREKDYLRALAGLLIADGLAGGSDVARQLDVSGSSVSYLRDRLLRKGTIYPEGRRLRFAVPGMATWIVERHDT